MAESLNYDPNEPTVIPDSQAYDRPGDVPTWLISQEKVDFGKAPEEVPDDDG